tara:strand:+ start:37 stop:354 length:318 start_codon:yes stop_codon:yes gene_type:complete
VVEQVVDHHLHLLLLKVKLVDQVVVVKAAQEVLADQEILLQLVHHKEITEEQEIQIHQILQVEVEEHPVLVVVELVVMQVQVVLELPHKLQLLQLIFLQEEVVVV